MRFVVDASEKKEPLGDLYGIFFEDLNHAADGGLYAGVITVPLSLIRWIILPIRI